MKLRLLVLCVNLLSHLFLLFLCEVRLVFHYFTQAKCQVAVWVSQHEWVVSLEDNGLLERNLAKDLRRACHEPGLRAAAILLTFEDFVNYNSLNLGTFVHHALVAVREDPLGLSRKLMVH